MLLLRILLRAPSSEVRCTDAILTYMGRTDKLAEEYQPESVLAPVDTQHIPYGPSLLRLRACQRLWEREELKIQKQVPDWELRPESATAQILGVYDEVLTRVSSAWHLIDELRLEQRNVSEHSVDAEEELLALVAFARGCVSATKDEDIAQECHDVQQRLGTELLTALHDFE